MSPLSNRFCHILLSAVCAGLPVVLAAPALQGRDDKEPPLPNKAGWHVEPDAVEPLKGPFNLTDSIPVPFTTKVVYPTTPGAFVAVTLPGKKDVYQVYDLRTMKPVGKPVAVANRFSSFVLPALAPDGKHMASRVKVGATGSTIEVWSVETGKSVLKLEPELDDKFKPKYCDLLGKGRLWVAKHSGEFPRYSARTTFQVWHVNIG